MTNRSEKMALLLITADVATVAVTRTFSIATIEADGSCAQIAAFPKRLGTLGVELTA